VVVVVGQNVELPMQMKVSTVQETVTVSGESPIVDTKAMGTATNFTRNELEDIPTSRDPWALLRTVPGVMVDRVNIAGNETGQQSNFQSKGTRPQDAVWTMDGVVITDMSAVGASPTYFNYDNFEEIQISTSGQDIRQPTGGVGLNFVVKRGTNELHGGARGFFTGEGLEWSNVPQELRNATPPVTPDTADHNKQIDDYGFDIGGPIVRDHAWFYGSYSRQDIRLVRRAGALIDRTLLDTFDVKGNWQVTRNNMFNVLWFLGGKKKYGRSPGTTGINFDGPEATWNQVAEYEPNRPHGLLKFEDNHTFGSRLFVTGKYAYYNTGFGLIPKGGLDTTAGESQITSTSYGSTRQAIFLRPQNYLAGDGNFFFDAFGASNELKFGAGWRRADAYTQTLWPGGIRALETSTTSYTARLYREGAGTDRAEYFNLYAGDTLTANRLTVDLGISYDRQWGSSLPSQTSSNPAFPDLVPGIDFAGYDAPFTWNNVSPRVGVTYSLDDRHRTIVRASFTRYAGQLENGIVGFSNPSGNAGYAEYGWVDLNGDHLAEPNELLTAKGPVSFGGGFNPAAPTAVVSADKIDPNLKAPTTMSAVVGVDRELVPNLALQVNYSYTRTNDYNGNFTNYYTPWVGLSAQDYVPASLLSGTIPNFGDTYSVQTYIPDPAMVAANGNGRILTNWNGYHSYFHGIEFQLVKRMSNRWMARIGGAWNNPKETYGDNLVNDQGNPTPVDTAPLVNGGAFVVRSGGSGAGDVFIHARWQFNANGVYQLPHDIELAGNVFGRQGYPFPVYRSVSLGLDGPRRVLVTPEIDTLRLANLWNTDVRVAKKISLGGQSYVQLIADLFNVFNANTELVRNRNAASSSFDVLAQNLSPRIVRFGLRVNF
jgi:hypothetical protein